MRCWVWASVHALATRCCSAKMVIAVAGKYLLLLVLEKYGVDGDNECAMTAINMGGEGVVLI